MQPALLIEIWVLPNTVSLCPETDCSPRFVGVRREVRCCVLTRRKNIAAARRVLLLPVSRRPSISIESNVNLRKGRPRQFSGRLKSFPDSALQ